MNYVAIVNEAIGDIYTVKDLCYYANNNKFWVGVYAGNDPTMLGQATFKSNSTDVRISVRYRHGKFYEVPNFSKVVYPMLLCLEDPNFFKKFRQLFVDNLCWREYTKDELGSMDMWRMKEQEAVWIALTRGTSREKP